MYWQRSIKNQLLMIILSICIVSLGMGVLVIGINYYQNNKSAMVADSISQAHLLVENVKSSGAINNPEIAQRVLAATVLDDSSGAALFDAIGRKLATRDGDGAAYISEVEFKTANEHYWGGDYLYVWETVEIADELKGVIYLKFSR